MRITGLATGLDMDQIIKDSMKPYRVRIQQQEQKKEVTEIKQKLYRDVLKDCREFYDKYFDVSKKDSLLLSSNWTSVKLESSNDSLVSVSGTSSSGAGNYTVSGTAATPAKITLTEGINKGEKIVIEGKEFTIKGENDKERAANLSKDLEKAGLKIKVRFTEFAGQEDGVNKKGFILESTILGKGNQFTVGGKISDVAIEGTKGSDATIANTKVEGLNIESLKTAREIKVGDKVIDLALEDGKEYTDKEILDILNTKLSDEKIELKASLDENKNIVFNSTKSGEVTETPISIINEAGETLVGVFENGTNATSATSSMDLEAVKGKTLFIDGKKVDLPPKVDGETDEEYLSKLNEELKKANIEVNSEIKDGKLNLSSKSTGSKSKIDVSIIDKPDTGFMTADDGTDANIVVKDDKGGTYTHKGNSNTITLDGITFKFNGEIKAGESVKISSKQDVTKVKDMVVNFMNDYNKVIEKLNTLVTDKRDKSYMPLTEEQKKDMSESEIKLWNERVEKGQLSRDMDLTRIVNSMKSAMNSFVEGNISSLEKIGIKPVADYGGAKHGTFTIDENKLTAALENNSEDVMKLFTGLPSDDKNLTESQKRSQTGLAQRLKTILYDETVTISSKLIKKAGIEGSSTVSNNELSKSVERQNQKIKDMEKDFSRREQALYSKYSRLEVMMNKYNSQQSYLMQQMGGM